MGVSRPGDRPPPPPPPPALPASPGGRGVRGETEALGGGREGFLGRRGVGGRAWGLGDSRGVLAVDVRAEVCGGVRGPGKMSEVSGLGCEGREESGR